MNPSWLLLLSPLVSATVIFLWLRPKPSGAMFVSVASCLVSFVVALGLFFDRLTPAEAFTWMEVGEFKVTIGLLIDPLSKLMLLVVTGVGSLIHIFSIGYMAEDAGRGRFFAKLSLFMFSMTGIVVANNLVMMFIFWELVGLSSYLLIGFWFEKASAADAAKKAFLTNRIGDFGFIIGILMFWTLTGSVAFADSFPHTQVPSATLTAMALLLFCGCMGKSAMVPLHVWLPDAMEGPTPVSALIHAATMVAAGVFMLCRIFYVLELSPTALTIIAYVGGFTAIFAALIATQQDDIKRILAYSTLSQLGYMVMAVGCHAPYAAMFHLTTHAFFKALLFLGAGAVIYAMHHEQNIWQMGGLRKKIPLTFWTFLIGTLALCGFPFTSGFYSKDEILLAAMHAHMPLFIVGVITAGLTTFYMFRLMIVVFFGKPRTDAASHAHEAPGVMTLPLVALAIPSLIGGWIGIRSFIGPVEEHHALGLAIGLFAVFAIGAFFAKYFYTERRKEPILIPLFANKFYIDEIYERTLLSFQDFVARVTAWFDNWILGVGIVRGTAGVANFTGEILRLFQAGSVTGYAFLFSLGAAALIYFFLL